MKNITRFSLGTLISIISLFVLDRSVQAIEVDGKTYCYLTIEESESTYRIIVPQDKIDFFREIPDLEVVGINCRNEKTRGYQSVANVNDLSYSPAPINT